MVLTSLIPGINIRRMSHYNYIATRDKVRGRIHRKEGQLCAQGKEHTRNASLPQFPLCRFAMNCTFTCDCKPLLRRPEKPRPCSGSAIWSRKLNEVQKGFARFDNIKRHSLTLLNQ